MFVTRYQATRTSQVVLVAKNPPASAGDMRDTGLMLRSGRSPGGGHGNPLSVLASRIPQTEEPGGLQSNRLYSRTRLKQLSMHTCTACITQIVWRPRKVTESKRKNLTKESVFFVVADFMMGKEGLVFQGLFRNIWYDFGIVLPWI